MRRISKESSAPRFEDPDSVLRLERDIFGTRLVDMLEYSLNKARRWEIFEDGRDLVDEFDVSEHRFFDRRSARHNHNISVYDTSVYAFYANGDDLGKIDELGSGVATEGDNDDASDLRSFEREDMQWRDREEFKSTFINDNFLVGMRARHDRKMQRKLRCEGSTQKWLYRRYWWQCHSPCKDPRVPFQLTASSSLPKTSMKSAKIYSLGHHKNVWSPVAVDNDNDFLLITPHIANMKNVPKNTKSVLITHIGTKGRFPQLSPRGTVLSPMECVSKYRLFFRESKASNWKPLGLFLGNRDRDTEIVHKLLDPVTGKPGILAAQIKLQPLGRREGGFCGRKSMRVAIYGFAVPEVSSSGLQRDSRALPESRDTTIDNQEEDRADVTQSSPGESHIFDSSVSGVILKVIQAPVHKNNGFRLNSSFRPEAYQRLRKMKRRRRVRQALRNKNNLERDFSAKDVKRKERK